MKKKIITLAIAAIMLFTVYATSQAACYNHRLIKVSQVAVTCTTDGRTEYRCLNCGEGYISTTRATGHKWAAATYSRPKTCSVCGTTAGAPLGR